MGTYKLVEEKYWTLFIYLIFANKILDTLNFEAILKKSDWKSN